jgi:hypothetical protein
MNLRIVFLVAALVFFLLAAARVPARVDWTNAGFAAVVASMLV